MLVTFSEISASLLQQHNTFHTCDRHQQHTPSNTLQGKARDCVLAWCGGLSESQVNLRDLCNLGVDSHKGPRVLPRQLQHIGLSCARTHLEHTHVMPIYHIHVINPTLKLLTRLYTVLQQSIGRTT